jgi:hypothetical protein
MAPAFALLRSSSRRREAAGSDQYLDSRYGDSGISAPNQGATWPEWSNSPVIQQGCYSPPADDAHKSSITITINLPWKSKSRSNSLPPTKSRYQPEPPKPATDTSPAVSPRHIPPAQLLKSHTIPARASPKPQAQPFFQETSRRSPRPQELVSRSLRQKPPTPLLGVLSPVSETFDERPRQASNSSDFVPAHHFLRPRQSPLPPSREFDAWYDASDEEEDQYEPTYIMPRSRSPAPERIRRSPLPGFHERRARSVEPTMYHRRRISTSSSSSSDAIESDGDSVAESGYGSFSSPHASEFGKAESVSNVYNKTATDYSMIIREVEADYQAARKTKTVGRTNDTAPGSAGSGISVDSGYTSGPQVLVPSAEDLWG